MDSKFIQNIQGNDFVKYEGLLNEFHVNGGKSIKTKLISVENGTYIFKAVVEGEKGTFQGYGDANESNVNKMIAPHVIRMAETRAKARALRDYNNIGMCSVEELGGDDVKAKKEYRTSSTMSAKCSGCGVSVPEKVKDFSTKKYKRVLCFDCQNNLINK